MTPQRTWLVECYSPGIDRAAVASAGARARAAAAALGADDARVEYLGALLVARDEVVFHAFAAPDPGLVHEASERAGIRFERIVESVSVGDGATPDALAALLADATTPDAP